MPFVDEHSTATFYVDQAFSDSLDESSLLRLDRGEKLKPDEQISIIPSFTLA